MFKFALKSLFARKLRLVLTTVAIVLGVAFVVSSFVIADSLRSTFDDLVEDIQGDVDLTIRTYQEFGMEQDRPPLDENLLAIVQDTEGVAEALPGVYREGVVPIKSDGDPVETFGPPQIGVNYTDTPLGQIFLREGRAPEGPDEFVMDIDTAEDEGFEIGETYTVTSETGNREFELVGLVAFGDDNDLVGAVLTAYDLPTAQEFLNLEGRLTNIVVRVDPGVERSVVAERLQAELPDGIEVADREVTIEEAQDEFGEIATIFGNVLLAFAIITLVVSAFLINNTFQIVIGQRVRELALLRAIGATGSQVQRGVLAESLVIGVVSTVIGIGAGVLLSYGLRGLFSALGFDLPEGPLILAPRTIIVAVIIGVGITLLASLAPARRARRVPPIAALRDDFQMVSASLTRRITSGTVVTVVGALLMGWALFGDLDTAPLLALLSLGALAVFVGVNLLSPLVARPVAKTLGAPIQAVYKTTGRLSRENAARNPRRTSSTAAALMIGLALVSMAGVVGDSIKTTFLDILGNAVTADYFVQPKSGGFGFGGLPPSYAAELSERPEFDSVVEYRFAPSGVKIAGDTKDITGTELDEFWKHIDIDPIEGDVENLGPGDILIFKDSAEDLGLRVGDTVDVTFVDSQTETFTVALIYDDASLAGNYVLDLQPWQEHFARDEDGIVTVRIADGVDPAQAQAAMDEVSSAYPQVNAQTKEEFERDQKRQLDSFLAVITGFLAFALLIALIGIANTLALSVVERTRELGLLRAVGMTRRQMRRMVRWEAAIVAVFGALLGVVLGIIFGIAAAGAVPSSVVKTISIPWSMIVIYVIAAGLAGLIAAFFPARRAGRLNVLDAIAHQ